MLIEAKLDRKTGKLISSNVINSKKEPDMRQLSAYYSNELASLAEKRKVDKIV